MGRTFAEVLVTNYIDICNKLPCPRNIDITSALVDSGAALLSLHPDQIEKLGLPFSRETTVVTANGIVKRRVFGGAQIEIMGRAAEFNVLEVSDDVPNLMGYIVLEVLDLIIDPKRQELIKNPAHNGEWTIDLYCNG